MLFELTYFQKVWSLDLIHKSAYGPCIQGNGNLRNVISHCEALPN